MSTLNTPIQHCTGVLASAVWQEKEIKGVETGKEEIKLALFSDNLIVNVEKPKESTQKTNQQKSYDCCEFSKLSEYKVNTHKPIPFL